MESLISEIQHIFKKIKKDEDSDKHLHFSPQYSSSVKVANWFLPLEAEPKDNDPYNPPGGNYFLSTYHRLGTDVTDMERTTHAMLSQVCSPELDQTVIRHRPMVSAATEELSKEVPFEYKGLTCGQGDFTTTYGYDFRHPFPYKKVNLKKPKAEEKRFCRPSNFSSPKICESKFLDDDFYETLKRKVSMPKLTPPYETHDEKTS